MSLLANALWLFNTQRRSYAHILKPLMVQAWNPICLLVQGRIQTVASSLEVNPIMIGPHVPSPRV